MFTHPQKNIEDSYIAEGMSVADLGCGIGEHAIIAAKKVGEAGAVYAIDIQKDLISKLNLEAGRLKLKNIHSIVGDIEKSGGSTLADQAVDRVLIFNTLFQLEDKTSALKEAKRILKNDGMLVLIDWKDSFNHLGPHPDHVVSREKAIELAKGAGLKPAGEFEAGEHHYGLLFKK